MGFAPYLYTIMGLPELEARVYQLLGIQPTPEQREIVIDPSRNKLTAGGERGGKSLTNAIILIWNWFKKCCPESLFWLLGGDYESCRGEWEHLETFFSRFGGVQGHVPKNIDPGIMKIKGGTRIITKSARYPSKIATVAPDGILICEAAQVDYDIFLRCRSRLAEKRGWLAMAGTFEEEEYLSWYRELYQLGLGHNNLDLRSFSLPTWTNTIKYPGGRQDPEILRQEAGMTPERFMERFGGVPCPKVGRVVTEFSNQIHVGKFWFDDSLPVEIAVDPGYAGAHAVLAVQVMGEQIVLIDEIYVQGKTTREVIDICKQKKWFGIRGERVIGGAIDIAARQHQAMDAPVELWLRETHIPLQSKKVNVEDGIDLLRTYLKPNPITGKPKILVDSKCRGLIAECGGGKSPVDGGGVWMRDKHTSKPIDKNNHSCKALIYWLANKFGFSERKTGGKRITVKRRAINES